MSPQGEERMWTAVDCSTSGRHATFLHVAVVFGVDGIAFLSAAHSSESLRGHIVRYICEQLRIKLQQEEAQRIAALLAKGCEEEGIELYFEIVSARWDPEHLHRQVVQVPLVPGMPSGHSGRCRPSRSEGA